MPMGHLCLMFAWHVYLAGRCLLTTVPVCSGRRATLAAALQRSSRQQGTFHRICVKDLSVFRFPMKKKIRGLSPRVNYTDRRLSEKLVPTFVYTACHLLRVTDPYGHILGFID
jgi:hypothetical protein